MFFDGMVSCNLQIKESFVGTVERSAGGEKIIDMQVYSFNFNLPLSHHSVHFIGSRQILTILKTIVA